MIFLLFLELLSIFFHLFVPSYTSRHLVFMLQGQVVYFLYYSHCLLAPIDLSKIHLLRSNQKFSCFFLGVICCLQNLIQGLFLDIVIYLVFSNRDYDTHPVQFYSSKVVEVILTGVAMGFIFRDNLRQERREIKIIEE